MKGFLHLISCHGQAERVLLLPPQFGWHLFNLARASNKMMNQSSKNGYPCLAHDFTGRVFSLSLLWCSSWVFHKQPLSDGVNSLLFLVCYMVLWWKGVGFFQMLFTLLLRWACVFPLHSIIMLLYTDLFLYLNQPCIFQVKCHLVYNPL